MPLQAVTDLKITQIRRRIETSAGNDRPNFLTGVTVPAYGNFFQINATYYFDLEWVNPNFDPHWTELTITQSGVRHTFDLALANEIHSRWTATPKSTHWYIYTEAEMAVIRAAAFGVSSITGNYSVDYLKDHQNTAFVGGNSVNKITGAYCRIYITDGVFPQTVTITVKTKTVDEAKTTIISRVINLSDASVIEGPTIPLLSANGTIQSRNLDGFFRTENDSKSLTGAMLGVGSSPTFNIASPLYDSDGITSSAQVRAANMQQGKFYKLTNTLSYGIGVNFNSVNYFY